jgi:hypothetical protein
VIGIAIDVPFLRTFGFVCGDVKPSSVPFDQSHQIQIVGAPNQAESHWRESFD